MGNDLLIVQRSRRSKRDSRKNKTNFTNDRGGAPFKKHFKAKLIYGKLKKDSTS